MSINTPIFTIAKDLNVESNRILLACKKLGIRAKGATKRLNKFLIIVNFKKLFLIRLLHLQNYLNHQTSSSWLDYF